MIGAWLVFRTSASQPMVTELIIRVWKTHLLTFLASIPILVPILRLTNDLSHSQDSESQAEQSGDVYAEHLAQDQTSQ